MKWTRFQSFTFRTFVKKQQLFSCKKFKANKDQEGKCRFLVLFWDFSSDFHVKRKPSWQIKKAKKTETSFLSEAFFEKRDAPISRFLIFKHLCNDCNEIETIRYLIRRYNFNREQEFSRYKKVLFWCWKSDQTSIGYKLWEDQKKQYLQWFSTPISS